MRVLLFGSRGYLGGYFLARSWDARPGEADITDSKAVRLLLEREKPDVVINAAGRTGRPNVDWCEDHKAETLHANVLGPLVLLEECARAGAKLVHLSSGCIYEGDGEGDQKGRGFTESDPPNFFGSYYARSKVMAEEILREFPVLILRLRMPFDGSRNERNLLMKLLKYPRVLDTQNSITYLPDFLTAAEALIRKRASGIYNIVNPGTTSPFEMMWRYRETVNPAHAFERLTLDGLPDVVKTGRSNCMLNGEKLAREGIRLRPVHDALDEALRALIP